MTITLRKYTSVLYLILAAVLLTSCANQAKKSDITPVDNQIQKIAIIGESKVFYPRMGGKSPLLDLASSKKVMEIHFPKAGEVLKGKGYEVTYQEPAGIGYLYINEENWVTEDYNNSDVKWQTNAGDPVYEYSNIKQDEHFHYIVKQAFEKATITSERGIFNRYRPVKYAHDLSVLGEQTGADTICFVRLYANRYTASRNAGEIGLIVLGALFGAYGGTVSSDGIGSSTTCMDVATNKVIWNGWMYKTNDPMDEDTAIVETVLKSFPQKGAPIAFKVY